MRRRRNGRGLKKWYGHAGKIPMHVLTSRLHKLKRAIKKRGGRV